MALVFVTDHEKSWNIAGWFGELSILEDPRTLGRVCAGARSPERRALERSGCRSSSGGDADVAQARVMCGDGKGMHSLCVLIAGAGASGQAGRERAAGDPPSRREAVDGERQ